MPTRFNLDFIKHRLLIHDEVDLMYSRIHNDVLYMVVKDYEKYYCVRYVEKECSYDYLWNAGEIYPRILNPYMKLSSAIQMLDKILDTIDLKERGL